MSRIIAGDAGSIRLASAPAGTRPTTDRVKESVFAMLESQDAISGSDVLDLFAGTLALGLEALSRGAKSLVGVEKYRPALEVCLKNASSVGTALNSAGRQPPIEIKLTDCRSFLAATTKEFDLIFMDPPYNLGAADVEQLIRLAAKVLRIDGLLVVEQAGEVESLKLPEGIEQLERRDYGDTAVFFFRAIAP